MKTKQWKLARLAREIGVEYRWLYYRVTTRAAPVDEKVAYTARDVEILRGWAAEEMSRKSAPRT